MAKLKGARRNFVQEFYGTADPDTPNISPEQLAKMWDQARPKIKGMKGKIIITGTGGELK